VVRLVHSFGNYSFRPSLIYANSSGNIPLEVCARAKRAGGYPIVLNQNGVYFPAWYSEADLEGRNQRMEEYFRLADHVIFQSDFCRQAFERWICPVGDKSHEILLNAPMPSDRLPHPALVEGRFRFALNPYTQPTLNAHVIDPLVEALSASDEFCVRMFGARELLSEKFLRQLEPLEKSGRLELMAPYSTGSFLRAHAGVNAFLHLSYKDPCPNSVAERICAGIPAVFTDSGGTPELVGNAGIGLPVEDRWDDLVPVQAGDLLRAMAEMRERHDHFLSLASRQAEAALGWGGYLGRHRELFETLSGVTEK
jgi:glycosyltransferase involved in cell wall biosynthesis